MHIQIQYGAVIIAKVEDLMGQNYYFGYKLKLLRKNCAYNYVILPSNNLRMLRQLIGKSVNLSLIPCLER